MKNKISIFLFSLIGGIAGAAILNFYLPNRVILNQATSTQTTEETFSNVNYKNANIPGSEDMVKASAIATPRVVFIKTISNQQTNDQFMDFGLLGIFSAEEDL